MFGDDDATALGGERHRLADHGPAADAIVMMTLLAIVPHVMSWRSGRASAIDDAVCGRRTPSPRPLELDGIDRHDALRAGELGALDGVGADAADADHGHRVAGLHLGR